MCPKRRTAFIPQLFSEERMGVEEQDTSVNERPANLREDLFLHRFWRSGASEVSSPMLLRVDCQIHDIQPLAGS